MNTSFNKLSLLGLLIIAPSCIFAENEVALAQAEVSTLVEVSEEEALVLSSQGVPVVELTEEEVVAMEAEEQAVLEMARSLSSDACEVVSRLATCSDDEVSALLQGLFAQVEGESLKKFSLSNLHLPQLVNSLVSGHNVTLSEDRVNLVVNLLQAYLDSQKPGSAEPAA
jgi:hypothetical protein